jgi:phosphoribosyl 1,2-cyclic phosphodiesterase
MVTKPGKLEIRSYNVGFGDCFLLSFHYPKEQKHVLIDFGSTEPPDGKKDFQTTIAEDIREVCGGKLHAVVATHRHKDHISGFATNKKGTASGDIIRACADAGGAVIIQPWTEDPEAPTDAKEARGVSTSRKAFVQQLDNMHAFASVVSKEIQRLDIGDVDPMTEGETAASTDSDAGDAGSGFAVADRDGTTASKSLRKRIAFIGEDNVKNLSAVQNLMAMSDAKKHRYVFFGARSGLEKVLPGVKTRVLGPPTIRQHEAVQKQRSVDPAEFWMLRQKFWRMQAANAGATLSKGDGKPILPGAKVLAKGKQPRASRWFIRRLRGARAKALLELVLIMDDAMNNTSVILLFEVGGKKLLFPGDAQIENWEFALHDPAILEALADVDVYKVGHHGSRNATPKTLWNNFSKRGDASKKDRLLTMVSTKAGKHGAAERHTEVPRKSLVDEMKLDSNYVTTQTLRKSLCNLEVIEF